MSLWKSRKIVKLTFSPLWESCEEMERETESEDRWHNIHAPINAYKLFKISVSEKFYELSL